MNLLSGIGLSGHPLVSWICVISIHVLHTCNYDPMWMLTFLATFSSSIFLQCFCSFIMINAIVWKWFWKAHIYWVLNFQQCWRQSALEVDKSCNNTCALSEHPNVHCSSSFRIFILSLFIVLNYNRLWKCSWKTTLYDFHMPN